MGYEDPEEAPMSRTNRTQRDFSRLPEPVRLEDTVASVPDEPGVEPTVHPDPETAFLLRYGAP